MCRTIKTFELLQLDKIAPLYFSKLSYSFWWRNWVFVSFGQNFGCSPQENSSILLKPYGETVENSFLRGEKSIS